MRGQDDGHALGAQPAHHLPHVLAQLDVDAGGRLVEEEDARFVRQRFGDHQPALHAAGQGHDLVVAFVPERKLSEYLLEVGRVGGLAEQPAEEAMVVGPAT